MRKEKWVVVILLLSSLILNGCRCGHLWMEANCIRPQTCALCGQTEGTAAVHVPGKQSQKYDFSKAEAVISQYCQNCSELLTQECLPMDSFAQDGIFLFSADAFLARFQALLANYYPEAAFDIIKSGEGNRTVLSLSRAASREYYVQFFSGEELALPASHWNSEKRIWCVSLGTAEAGNREPLLEKNLLECFAMACDPGLDREECEAISLVCLTSTMNSMGYGDIFGYYRKNSLLYEFGYYPISKPEGLEIVYGQTVQIYASDWQVEYNEDK